MSERSADAQRSARSRRAPRSDTRSIGIDIGSTNTKIVLLSIDADTTIELATASFPTPDDPSALVVGVESALRRMLDEHPSTLVAAGIAAMAETGVPLDDAGDPVGAVVRWNRAAASPPSSLVGRLGADALFGATGVPPLGKAPLLVLDVLRRADPERWARLARWAGVGDLVTRALTGRLVTDHTLAGRTLAYRLPPAGVHLPDRFDADLLAEVGLTPDALPEVVMPGEPAGVVTADAAERTGIAAGTPVFVAGHDHAVGAWGAGVRDPGRRADSVGTSEALLRIAGAPVDRAAALAAGMSLTRTVSGALETLLAGSPAGGALIGALLRGNLGGTPLDADDVFASAPTGGPSAIALPYPLGRQCPSPDPAARLRMVDLDGDDLDPRTLPPRDLAAAVLLGLSLQLRWMGEEQRRITGEPAAGAMRVLGAAAIGNAAWMRLRADVLGESLEPSSSAEPVAAAAALLAAVRAGAADPDIELPCASPILPAAPIPPAATADRYADAFAVFVAAATDRPRTAA